MKIRERIQWIVVPAGTPTKPRRISVIVEPVVEADSAGDTAGLTLEDLKRFYNWPQFFSDELELYVQVETAEGTRTVRLPPPCNEVPLDPTMWAIFPSFLPVRPRVLSEIKKAKAMRPYVLAPPAEMLDRLTQRTYLRALARAVKEPNAVVDERTGFSGFARTLGGLLLEPPNNWSGLLGQYAKYRPQSSSLEAPLETPATDDAFNQALAQLWMFHGRPPLPIFPALEKREVMVSASGAPVKRVLEGLTLVTRGDIGKNFRHTEGHGYLLPRLGPDNAPLWYGSFENHATSTFVIETTPGDSIGTQGEMITVGPGERIEIREELGFWAIVQLRILIGKSHVGKTLYGDPAPWTDELLFVLPDHRGVDPDFQVTVRNSSSAADDKIVRVARGEGDQQPVELRPGEGQVFRATHQGFATEPENFRDFHQTLASLRSFPAVLRKLGLIFDFDLPEFINLGNDGKLRLEVRIKGKDLDELSSCRWSAYQVFKVSDDSDDKLFFLPGTEKLPRYPELTNYHKGLLAAPPGRYSLAQLDTDASGMRIAFDALRHEVNEQQPRRIAVTDLPRGEETPKSELPALRQIGISLCDAWLEADVLYARQRGEIARANTSADGDVLYAPDLMQGYRVDIRRDRVAGSPWRSLCKREGSYRFAGQDKPWTYPDEGFLGQTADQVGDPGGNSEGLRMARALFRWDGWSLVAERPGTPVGDGGPDRTAEREANWQEAPVVARFKPSPGSLEPARFGRFYSFRLRHVDLAGNSLTTDEATLAWKGEDPSAVAFRSGPLGRLEPIPPPVLLPCQNPGDGESNDQLVIRTCDDETEETAKEWYVVPPQTTAVQAELHGVFDDMEPKESYEILCTFDGELPKWEVTDQGVETRGYSRKWLAHYEEAGGLRVPYLPDPMACEARVAVQGCEGTVARLLFQQNSSLLKYPRNIRVPKLAMRSGRSRMFRSDCRLEIALPPGRSAVLELSSAPCEADLDKLGLLHWADASLDAESSEIRTTTIDPKVERHAVLREARGLSLSSGLALITPRRRVALVHAVQRPVLPQGLKEIVFECAPRFRFENPFDVEIALGSTSPTIRGEILLDRPSTAKLDFLAEWKEPIDDPRIPDWLQVDRSAAAFEIKVEALNSQLVKFDAVSCEDPEPSGPCAFAAEHFPFSGVQKFQDTRHRLVTFRAIATSRYVEFFEAKMREGKDPEETKKLIREHFTRLSAPCSFHVPATAPPAPPEPYYIVPTFAFEETREGRAVTTVRKGRGLRIYLKRGWFSSGEGEMLGVVLAQSQWSQLPEPLSQFTTEWGLDPVWGNDSGLLPPRPVLENFKSAPERVGGLLTSVLVQKPGSNPGTAESVEIEIAVAAYPVEFDRDKGLLYADIEIDGFDAYYPFIRLGLARYQKYALTSAELSPIVRAEFVPVAPDRIATVTYRGDDCLDIVVAGPDAMLEKHCPALATRVYWEVHWDHLDHGFLFGSELLATLEWHPGKPGQAIWTGNAVLPKPRGTGQLRLVERWSRVEEAPIIKGTLEERRNETIVAIIPIRLNG